MTLRRRFLVLSLTSLIAVIAVGVVLIVTFDHLVKGSKAVVSGVTPGSEGAKQLHDLAQLADWYAILLVVAVAFLLVWVAVVTYGLRRDVLQPLRRLRHELSVVTGGSFETPISAGGPPEIAEVGADAEAMRRSLVTQIDGAQAARAGLAQDGPLATAINHELATPTDTSAPGYSLHGLRHAAEGVISGDWWDAVALPNGCTGVVVADATGHGPAAGIAALRVKTATRLLLADGVGPAEIMTQMDHVFQDSDGRFVTLFVAVLDPNAQTITWANAGHVPALLRTDTGDVTELAPSGPLLSMLSGTWTEHSAPFNSGAVLVAYSDGLAESLDAQGKQLKANGITGLLESAIAEHGLDMSAVASQMEVAARVRAANWATDDVTLLVVSPSTV